MESPLKKSKSLRMDEILPLIGEFGKFQIMLEIAFSIIKIPESMLILIPYFVQDIPSWRCSRNSTVCTYNGTFGQQNRLYESRCQMPRSEWEYTQPKDYSIITQFDLYCDREAYSHLAISLFFVSWAVGALVLGYTSDRYGRRKTMLPSISAVLIIGFLTPFSPNIYCYMITRVFVGFFFPGSSVQMFILMSEYVGPKWRPLAGMILWLSYSFNVVLLGVIAYFVRTWKVLLILTTAPLFITLFLFKFIPESSRWLNVNGKTEESMKILKTIAKVNGKEFPDIKLEGVKQNSASGFHHFKGLFRPEKIAIRSLIQGYAWMACGFVYYGVSFAVDDLGGDMYRDYILSSSVNFPAVVIAVYLCNKIGRKNTTLIPMLLSGLACIAVSIIPQKTKIKDLLGLRVFLGIMGKLYVSVAFDALYTWSTELYPTVIRGSGMGFLQIACRIGAAIAPWSTKWLITIHAALPFSLMGGSAVICAIFLYWLPETGNTETMETLHDQFDLNENEEFTSLIDGEEEGS